MKKEIKLKSYPEELEEVAIVDMKVTYCQCDDQRNDEFQHLDVSVVDGGGGPYLVLQTDRWAINNIDELINTLEDFKKRASFE